MTALSIYLFGSVQVVRDDHYPVKLRPTAKAMFAYLVLNRYRTPHRVGHRREVLANHFWSSHDERNARRCLSTTLWRLRRELEPGSVPHGTYLVASSEGDLSFNFSSDHWLDVFAFEEKVRRGMARPVSEMDGADAQALEEAQELYMGELLEDCYGDWVLRERERFNLLHLNALARLMRYYEHHQNYGQSLVCGQKILAIDPLREQVHRHMMRLYMMSGQRALAVQQYEACRTVLAEELRIQPMAETQALRNEIVSALEPAPVIATLSYEKPGTLQHAVQQLGAAIRNLDQAQEQLQQAKMMVARFTEPHTIEGALLGQELLLPQE